MLVVVGVILFIGLIIIHEFGHFIVAKRNGVKVEEFGIGFPPRLWGKKFKGDDTLYSINWLPLGGFVKLKGEHESDRSKHSFGAAPFKIKAKIMLAGVMMNLIAAAIILSIVAAVGLPRLINNQFAIAADTKETRHDVLVTYVANKSPADLGGIKSGDTLLAIGGEQIENAEDVSQLAQKYAGKEIEVEYVTTAGEQRQAHVRLNDEYVQDEGFIGISAADAIEERSTWSAPIRGIGLTVQLAWLTLKGLAQTIAQVFAGQGAAASQNVAGPIGIVVLLNDISHAGFNYVLLFVAIISITLAVINALPIPALDGGRLFVSWLVNKVLKRPIDARLEERIHAAGMALLLLAVLLISVIDIKRFF